MYSFVVIMGCFSLEELKNPNSREQTLLFIFWSTEIVFSSRYLVRYCSIPTLRAYKRVLRIVKRKDNLLLV